MPPTEGLAELPAKPQLDIQQRLRLQRREGAVHSHLEAQGRLGEREGQGGEARGAGRGGGAVRPEEEPARGR